MSNKICNVGHFESMDDVNLFLRACELKGLLWSSTNGNPTKHILGKPPLSINIWDDNTITHSHMTEPDIDFRDKIQEMCHNYIVSTKEKKDIPELVDVLDYCNGESVRIENGKIQGSHNPGFYYSKKETHLFVTADEYNRIMRNGTQPRSIFSTLEKEAMLKATVDTGSSAKWSTTDYVDVSPYSTAKSVMDVVREGYSPDMLDKQKSRLTFKKVL